MPTTALIEEAKLNIPVKFTDTKYWCPWWPKCKSVSDEIIINSFVSILVERWKELGHSGKQFLLTSNKENETLSNELYNTITRK